MDPVTLIVAALVAGAASGTTDTVSQAMKDGYAGLKKLLVSRFGDSQKALQTLDDHEDDPETYEKPLVKQLRESQADQDDQILKAAEAVLQAANEAGFATKYQVVVSGGKVGIVGDHGHVTVN
ncbi:hypothetical protein [Arthrobacter sp. Rue61a]|uniref:hypothetical protein n=1 Tax=Arthrobacter sp. Rue61a TaxID=1118963 RepID=UPI00027DFBF6|nr:hypothetical protein [Arthrobacter sp. Rue61a]AFR28659.1 hypothetical protein ARUE_c17530 [Arthrobacter sp. Rue61a]